MANDQKIKVLNDVEHCILRPAIWIGPTQIHKQVFWVQNQETKLERKELEFIPGLFKIVSEVIDNSIDEHIRGFGDSIEIEYNTKIGSYRIKDNARGIPIEIHKETGKYTPELVFGQLRAGSNFDEAENGRTTVGMNGVGATLTTIFSDYLNVTVKRDNKIYTQKYDKNLSKINAPIIEKNNKQKLTGTEVEFLPDYSIFKQKLPVELLQKRCLELSVMYPKLTMKLIIDGKETIYNNKKFEDFVKLFDSQYTIFEDEKSNTKLALVKNKFSETFEHFSNINGADTFRGGTHVDAVKDMFSEDFKEKIYKETKLDITNSDVNKQLVVVLFQIWNMPEFEGQTKEKFVNDKTIVKKFYEDLISKRRITSMYSEVPDIKTAIIDDVTFKNEKKNLLEIKKLQKNIDRKKIAKLIDCSSKDRIKCSLYITEGDSAISNIAMVRDSKYMAGLPLRGKVLNVMECSTKDVIANKEIQSIMSAIGLKIGESAFEHKNGKITNFNLNYGKIIIASDQDMDGYSIRCLLINFFFKYWPELFEFGVVSILETPLYEVINNKNKDINYFYNKQDYEKYISNKNTSNLDISYFKGLGSCGKEAWNYMINTNPNLLTIISEDFKTSSEKLKLAFGDDSDKRKEWLMNKV